MITGHPENRLTILLLRRPVRAARRPAGRDKTHRAIFDVAGESLRTSDRPTTPVSSTCHANVAHHALRVSCDSFEQPWLSPLHDGDFCTVIEFNSVRSRRSYYLPLSSSCIFNPANGVTVSTASTASDAISKHPSAVPCIADNGIAMTSASSTMSIGRTV